MNRPTWNGLQAWRSWLTITGWKSILLFSLWIVGCGSEDGTPKASHFEHDHVIAPHWPSDLPDVAAKLRQRVSSPDEDAQTLEQIQDLVSWTAEVAADTDLSEADWMPLYHASESLMANLCGAERDLSSDNRSQIESLCQLIDDAAAKIPDSFASLETSSP